MQARHRDRRIHVIAKQPADSLAHRLRCHAQAFHLCADISQISAQLNRARRSTRCPIDNALQLPVQICILHTRVILNQLPSLPLDISQVLRLSLKPPFSRLILRLFLLRLRKPLIRLSRLLQARIQLFRRLLCSINSRGRISEILSEALQIIIANQSFDLQALKCSLCVLNTTLDIHRLRIQRFCDSVAGSGDARKIQCPGNLLAKTGRVNINVDLLIIDARYSLRYALLQSRGVNLHRQL